MTSSYFHAPATTTLQVLSNSCVGKSTKSGVCSSVRIYLLDGNVGSNVYVLDEATTISLGVMCGASKWSITICRGLTGSSVFKCLYRHRSSHIAARLTDSLLQIRSAKGKYPKPCSVCSLHESTAVTVGDNSILMFARKRGSRHRNLQSSNAADGHKRL